MSGVVLPPEVETLLQEYAEAAQATASWRRVAYEKRKQIMDIINATGYDTSPTRLDAPVLPGIAGQTMFEVRPVFTERLDQRLLKEKYPEVYQACLNKTASFKVVQPNVEIGAEE